MDAGAEQSPRACDEPGYLLGIQEAELSRHLLLAECFAKGVVKTAKTAERLIIAKPIDDPRMSFQLETSRPGVFAVRSGNIRRVTSAVGEGSIVLSFVNRVLAE